MIRKINVKHLKPGMYIDDMNCGWTRHPFLTSRITVRDETTIKRLGEYGISEVYIDTDRGPDVEDDLIIQRDDRLPEELDRIADSKYSQDRKAPLEEEIVRAREIRKEAKQTVRDIMEEVRFGRPITTEKVGEVVDKMVDSVFRNQDALITLGRIKQADEYTYIHSMSVCVLMISFGRYLGFDVRQLKDIGIGAMLHDVGKMKVPDKILNHKGALNDEEYELMKKHVEYSHLLLEETKGISELSVIIASQHHERLDGKGYPNCLKGDDISIYGQTAAIADVYDAMTSKRCYQQRFEPTEVLKNLYEWNNLYNKDLVQKFIRCVGIYPVGSLVRLESGLVGIVLDQGNGNLLQPSVRIIYDTGKSKYIKPIYDVDLSRDCEDGISGYELTEKWNISPEHYL